MKDINYSLSHSDKIADSLAEVQTRYLTNISLQLFICSEWFPSFYSLLNISVFLQRVFNLQTEAPAFISKTLQFKIQLLFPLAAEMVFLIF
jgi:hypothetical protein